MLIQLYDSSSSGQWINLNSAWWFGIKNNGSDWLTMICIGDPASTTETTVLWFGAIHSTQSAAESELDSVIGDINAGPHGQTAPYIRFNGSQSTFAEGTVTIRYVGVGMINNVVSEGDRMALNTGTFPQFEGTDRYSTSAATESAVDTLASDINDLLT